MPSSIPVLTGRQVVHAFAKLGWQVARQRASHIILTKPGEIVTLRSRTIAKWLAGRCGR